MDFKLSYNWLKEFVDVELAPEEIAGLLSLHSMSVERWRAMDEGLNGVVVGQVMTIERHPNADRLSVAQVDIGRKRLQIIFGQMITLEVGVRLPVAVAPTVLPGGVEIVARVLRGVQSEGMLCLDQELGLASEREPARLRTFGEDVPLGTKVAKALHLDDVVFDVEVTTNRPDCMSVMGLAREVAAITGVRFQERISHLLDRGSRRSKPSCLQLAAGSLQLRVSVEDATRCPMYTGTVIAGVHVGPSPAWVQQRLLAGGIRPINNIVDATNYTMLETGQPLHAFDAEKLQAASRKLQAKIIDVRYAKKGESLLALDGETYTLTPDMLVIADEKQPVAIAGVMGGEATGVTDATTTIVLEAATFDPMSVRKTWRALDLRSESSVRYEKGVPPESVAEARERAVALILALAGGSVSGKPVHARKLPPKQRAIALDFVRVNAVVGVAVAPAKVKRSLVALGCAVAPKARGVLSVTPPWWRRGDLEQAHDLIEEVARIYGYHALPSVLPDGTLPAAVAPPTPPMSMFDWEDRARRVLADLGAVEVMAFSMTNRAVLERAGFNAADALALENPLTDDLTHLRPSLVPTMLEIIARNQGEVQEAVLFEFAQVYHAVPRAIPEHRMEMLLAAYGRDERAGARVRIVQGLVYGLLNDLGVPAGVWQQGATGTMWHPGRSAQYMVGERAVVEIGEIHPSIRSAFGIDGRVALAIVHWDTLHGLLGTRSMSARPPEYPAVKRDLAFVLDARIAYADLAAYFAAAHPLLESAMLFDEFSGASIPARKKSLAFHLVYRAPDRTLTAAEVDAAHAEIITQLEVRFSAAMRE